jgi:hypothetical protein
MKLKGHHPFSLPPSALTSHDVGRARHGGKLDAAAPVEAVEDEEGPAVVVGGDDARDAVAGVHPRGQTGGRRRCARRVVRKHGMFCGGSEVRLLTKGSQFDRQAGEND